jgi:hypothetical protein
MHYKINNINKSINQLYSDFNNLNSSLEFAKKNIIKNNNINNNNVFIETKHKIYLRKILLQILIKFQKNYNNQFKNIKNLPIYQQKIFNEINNKIIKNEFDINLINDLIDSIKNEFKYYYNKLNNKNDIETFIENNENTNFLFLYEKIKHKNFFNIIPPFQNYIIDEIYIFKNFTYKPYLYDKLFYKKKKNTWKEKIQNILKYFKENNSNNIKNFKNINENIENFLNNNNNILYNKINFIKKEHNDFYNNLFNYKLNVNKYILFNMQNTLNFDKNTITKEIFKIFYKIFYALNFIFYKKDKNNSYSYNIIKIFSVFIFTLFITFIKIFLFYGFYLILLIFSVLTYYFNIIFITTKKQYKQDIINYNYINSKTKFIKYIEFAYLNYINYIIYISFKFIYNYKQLINFEYIYKFFIFFLFFFINKLQYIFIFIFNLLKININIYNLKIKIKYLIAFFLSDTFFYISSYTMYKKITKSIKKNKYKIILNMYNIIKYFFYLLLLNIFNILYNIKFLHKFGFINTIKYWYFKYKIILNNNNIEINFINYDKSNINIQEEFKNTIKNSKILKKYINIEDHKDFHFFEFFNITNTIYTIIKKYILIKQYIILMILFYLIITILIFSIFYFPFFIINTLYLLIIEPIYDMVKDLIFDMDILYNIHINKELLITVSKITYSFIKEIVKYVFMFPFNTSFFRFILDTFEDILIIPLTYIIKIFIKMIIILKNIIYYFLLIFFKSITFFFKYIFVILFYPLFFLFSFVIEFIMNFFTNCLDILNYILKIFLNIIVYILNNIFSFIYNIGNYFYYIFKKIINFTDIYITNKIQINYKPETIEIIEYYNLNNFDTNNKIIETEDTLVLDILNYITMENSNNIIFIIILIISIQYFFFIDKIDVGQILYNNLLFNTNNIIYTYYIIKIINILYLFYIIYLLYNILYYIEIKTLIQIKDKKNKLCIPEIPDDLINKNIFINLINITINIYNLVITIIYLIIKNFLNIILIFIHFNIMLIYFSILFFKHILYNIKKFKKIFNYIFSIKKLKENNTMVIYNNILNQQINKTENIIFNKYQNTEDYEYNYEYDLDLINKNNSDNALFNLFIMYNINNIKDINEETKYNNNILNIPIINLNIDLNNAIDKYKPFLKIFDLLELEYNIDKIKLREYYEMFKEFSYKHITQTELNLDKLDKNLNILYNTNISSKKKIKPTIEQNTENLFLYFLDIFKNILSTIQKKNILKHIFIDLSNNKLTNLKKNRYYYYNILLFSILYFNLIFNIFNLNLSYKISELKLNESIDFITNPIESNFEDFEDFFNDSFDFFFEINSVSLLYIILIIFFSFTKKLEKLFHLIFTFETKIILLSFILFICLFFLNSKFFIILTIIINILFFRKFLKKTHLYYILPYKMNTKNIHLTFYLIKQLTFSLIFLLFIYMLSIFIINIKFLDFLDVEDIFLEIFTIFWLIFFLLFFNFLELIYFIYIYFTIIFHKNLLILKKNLKNNKKINKNTIIIYLLYFHCIIYPLLKIINII